MASKRLTKPPKAPAKTSQGGGKMYQAGRMFAMRNPAAAVALMSRMRPARAPRK
jgi:hypothetical protein